ncbi:hypothetical protein J2Y69_003558 [Microbacterium resistens]|uniref:Integral membrane protein n=1 Tax=Microbacterium resistens TaxID=156977 RepID=A0ABU1SH31_9MICO|nr:hypothetical protein [Microbacterium resistens]MDR6868932.1 hypothetical protein [Microbacterium resistens]
MTDASPRPEESRRRVWPFIVLAALCILPILVTAGVQYLDGRENVSYRCTVDADLPEGAAIGEDNLVSSAVTAFPAGRLCVYKAEGGGTVSVQTGWTPTLIGAAATIIATALTIAAYRRRSRIVVFIPLAGIALLWLIVIVNARTTTR